MTKVIVAVFPKFHPKTHQSLYRIINHMIDSTRSVQRNIAEGFKRASTKEYIEFLGFAIASLAELRDDFSDCLKSGLITPQAYTAMENLLRGEDVMLGRQIQSLENKMTVEGTRPVAEKFRERIQGQKRGEKGFEGELKKMGLVRLPDGRYFERKVNKTSADTPS